MYARRPPDPRNPVKKFTITKPAVIEAPEIEEGKAEPAVQEQGSQEGSELVKEEIPAATATAAAREKISEPERSSRIFSFSLQLAKRDQT